MSTQEIQRAVQRAVQTMPHGKSIRRVRLFGSHLHGDAKPDSDVDLIVDFDREAPIGLFELVDVENSFREALGCKVDVVTAQGLKQYIRDQVLSEAETLYEQLPMVHPRGVPWVYEAQGGAYNWRNLSCDE